MIRIERCLSGRLRDAYPVGELDVEIRIEEGLAAESLTEVLATESERWLAEHPGCRKVVYAPRAADVAAIRAAELAEFRLVVDVDVREDEQIETLSLLVREPAFVTEVDMDLDHVPQT